MKIDRRAFVEWMFVALGIAGVGGAARAAQARSVEVSMENAPRAVFVPEMVTISAGDTVVWSNPGIIPHTVTFDPKEATNPALVSLPAGVEPFDSGDMDENAVFKHTFTAKGTYKYVCKYHDAMGMVGTVVVT